jgi:hypothetical protein
MKRSALCLLPLLALLLAAPARAQDCLTCRTERCPKKANITRWCGQGPDPLALDKNADGPELDSTPSGATAHL